jgi:hypothetical protein
MRRIMNPRVVDNVDVGIVEDVVAADVDNDIVMPSVASAQIAAPTATPAVKVTTLLATNPDGDQ